MKGDIEKRIRLEKERGKPESSLIYLSVFYKSAKELIKLRKAIKPFYDKYELGELDKWILYKSQYDK